MARAACSSINLSRFPFASLQKAPLVQSGLRIQSVVICLLEKQSSVQRVHFRLPVPVQEQHLHTHRAAANSKQQLSISVQTGTSLPWSLQMKTVKKGARKASAKKQGLEQLVRQVLSSHAVGLAESNEDGLDENVMYLVDEMWEAGVLQPLSKEQLAADESTSLSESSITLCNAVGQLLQELGFAADSEQSRQMCDEVVAQWRGLYRPKEEQTSEEESADEEEEVPPGCCELCKRFMPLTFHHLVPKATHKLVVKRKVFSKDEVNVRGINICRPCHSSIHRLIDNKQMAFEYNSLEKLLEHEGVQKWITWAEKQRTVAKDHAIKGLRYHR